MLTVSNLSFQFGNKILFEEVNIKFTKGNCYGIIGANGAGKSTFLKILSGEQDYTSGKIHIEPGKRLSVLKQDHSVFDNYTVLETVIIGNKKLYDIKQEMDFLYKKDNFSETDGIKAGELGLLYEEMGGWNTESDAANLLSSLGVKEEEHLKKVKHLNGKDKVRVLLAQAIFGNPDILILDEPTNDLDVDTINWFEDFLSNYENTVIVVSHDRHFLDSVCTHICDLDFGQIKLFTGNYTFWYQASQLAIQQQMQHNKKTEEKRKELQEFIQRFSSNVAKARQATARKKMLDKLNLNFNEIKPSSRKYPALIFEQEREAGNKILEIKNLSQSFEGNIIFQNLSVKVNRGDKIAILSSNSKAPSILYKTLAGKLRPESGNFSWGITTKQAYLPSSYEEFFKNNLNMIDWLRQYVEKEEENCEEYLRGFLGKMLFSGDETLKKTHVLSGGEKMRCMFSKMMLLKANVLMFYEPTNHLDLESITSLNNSLKSFKGTILITSKDQELIQTVCNRIVKIEPHGLVEFPMEYLK
ncbi:MAG: ABC-F family ATP-binding cassette domain-containing protein [Candidatus Walczuchella monophlebidarum]